MSLFCSLAGKSKSVLDVARGSIEQPEEQMGSTPPPSHLVAKLFPQLKPKEKIKPAQVRLKFGMFIYLLRSNLSQMSIALSMQKKKP